MHSVLTPSYHSQTTQEPAHVFGKATNGDADVPRLEARLTCRRRLEEYDVLRVVAYENLGVPTIVDSRK